MSQTFFSHGIIERSIIQNNPHFHPIIYPWKVSYKDGNPVVGISNLKFERIESAHIFLLAYLVGKGLQSRIAYKNMKVNACVKKHLETSYLIT